VLDHWTHLVPQFVKVMPTDYKRVLQARRSAQRPPTNVPARPRLRAVEG
jgi:glutamate synthase (NADPH/NADH) large chain